MGTNQAPQAVSLTDEAARELLEVALAIETMASRAADQLEATFFAYAKRSRAHSQIAGSLRMAGDCIIDDDLIIED